MDAPRNGSIDRLSSNHPVQRIDGPSPHRCNPELEKVIEGLYEFPPNVREPFFAFVACLQGSLKELDESRTSGSAAEHGGS